MVGGRRELWRKLREKVGVNSTGKKAAGTQQDVWSRSRSGKTWKIGASNFARLPGKKPEVAFVRGDIVHVRERRANKPLSQGIDYGGGKVGFMGPEGKKVRGLRRIDSQGSPRPEWGYPSKGQSGTKVPVYRERMKNPYKKRP
ncbi:hypothetical protein A2118_03475 [Candidatus Kaiserbacteria bacterium GWA2_50_9]|uniref:Uncharacterized protein n=1 Tax=Candidatus Kaiserbacteria bacterium GWA2_50_9 TaxID=1798474 RepID=A0A1F6BWU6_9BACT|nr:MAG: hypothetical protein A2118_03475 [Candidatus Kaiserbacteria bacterium GWA2_50_9]